MTQFILCSWLLIGAFFWILGYKAGIKTEQNISDFWKERLYQEADQNRRLWERLRFRG